MVCLSRLSKRLERLCFQLFNPLPKLTDLFLAVDLNRSRKEKGHRQETEKGAGTAFKRVRLDEKEHANGHCTQKRSKKRSHPISEKRLGFTRRGKFYDHNNNLLVIRLRDALK